MLERLVKIFDRVKHEFGGNEVFSKRRVAGIDAFEHGPIRLEKPTRIFYTLKMLPDFERESAEMKLLSHGIGFGPVPQLPGGIMGYSEEMCSHITKLGTYSYLDAGVKMIDYNHGLRLCDIFNVDDKNDAMLVRIAARERETGVLFDRTEPSASRHLQTLGFR